MVWKFGDYIAGTSASGWAAVPFARTAGCGRIVTAETGLVQLRRKLTPEGPVAYAAGVQVCGSVWNCPACCAKIKTRRGLELSVAGTRHIDAGGTIGILTLTMRHQRRHQLATLVDGLNDAWRALQQTREWRDIRRPGGQSEVVLHTAKSLEATRGHNGWHPHLHILLFAPDDDALDAIYELASAKWADRVQTQLGAECRPDDDHGVNLVRAPSGDAGAARTLAKYISKFTMEVTRSDVKGSDALASLVDGIAAGEVQAMAEYVEWSRAMKGRRAVVFSRGLRARYLHDVEAKTDEELAAELEGGDVAAQVPRGEWLRLCRDGLVPWALSLVEDGTVPDRWKCDPTTTPVRPSNRYQRKAREAAGHRTFPGPVLSQEYIDRRWYSDQSQLALT